MPGPEPLQQEQYYHIYNRGVNGEPLFREERNYRYFLRLWAKYIEPVAETYAYCLLTNRFHFLVHIRETETGPISEIGSVLVASRQFSNLFIAYAKAFHEAYDRTGSLFESRFRRKLVGSDRYSAAPVAYTHRNPQKHGFVDDFCNWPYSSYHAVLSNQATRVQRAAVLDCFDGPAGFRESHTAAVDEAAIEPLIAEDWM